MASPSSKRVFRKAFFRWWRSLLLSSWPEIVTIGVLILLYITVSVLVIWDVQELLKPEKDFLASADKLLENMKKILDQTQVDKWWISGTALMAMRNSKGNQIFNHRSENVIQISMHKEEVDRLLEYVNTRFTAYDRTSVNISTNPNDCVSPFKLYSLEDNVRVEVVSFGVSEFSSRFLATCWNKEYGSSWYKRRGRIAPGASKLSIWPQKEYSAAVYESKIFPTHSCLARRFTVNCPASIPSVLKTEFGTTRPRSTFVLMLARLCTRDRIYFWAPLLCMLMMTCCVLFVAHGARNRFGRHDLPYYQTRNIKKYRNAAGNRINKAARRLQQGQKYRLTGYPGRRRTPAVRTPDNQVSHAGTTATTTARRSNPHTSDARLYGNPDKRPYRNPDLNTSNSGSADVVPDGCRHSMPSARRGAEGEGKWRGERMVGATFAGIERKREGRNEDHMTSTVSPKAMGDPDEGRFVNTQAQLAPTRAAALSSSLGGTRRFRERENREHGFSSETISLVSPQHSIPSAASHHFRHISGSAPSVHLSDRNETENDQGDNGRFGTSGNEKGGINSFRDGNISSVNNDIDSCGTHGVPLPPRSPLLSSPHVSHTHFARHNQSHQLDSSQASLWSMASAVEHVSHRGTYPSGIGDATHSSNASHMDQHNDNNDAENSLRVAGGANLESARSQGSGNSALSSSASWVEIGI